MNKLFFSLGNGFVTYEACERNRRGAYPIVEVETDTLSSLYATECKLVAVHGLKPKPPVVTKRYRGVTDLHDWSMHTFPTPGSVHGYYPAYIGVVEETFHDGHLAETKYIPKCKKG